jgi:hypothetical protein
VVFGGVMLLAAFFVMVGRVALSSGPGPRPIGALLRVIALTLSVVGALLVLGSTIIIIEPGQVVCGMSWVGGSGRPASRSALRKPLVGGRAVFHMGRTVSGGGRVAETIPALSSEQMAMNVDVAVRWQIDAREAPKLFNETGPRTRSGTSCSTRSERVRDGMVQYSTNDIQQRNKIAAAMGQPGRFCPDLAAQGRRSGVESRTAPLFPFEI